MSLYKISSSIADAIADLRSQNESDGAGLTPAAAHSSAPEAPYVFNSPRDTKYANHKSALFSENLFLFTQQWVGIRQACGAFPVSKVAIDGYHKWATHDILGVLDGLERMKIRRVIAHGMAPNTKFLLAGLKEARPDLDICSVWHGTMASWAFDHELRLFQDVIDLADKGVISRIAFLRRGMGDVHQKGWKVALMNVPPLVNINRISNAFSSRPINCLFASWNNQWKNMYTNLVGAANSSNVNKVYCYQRMAGSLVGKLQYENYSSFNDHMTRLAATDLCLNISINDCQPMTELESIAVGTPSLRPNLDHGVASFSEYDQLFTVNDHLNASAITNRIDMLCSEEPSYLKEAIDRYKSELIDLSYRRYADFFNMT